MKRGAKDALEALKRHGYALSHTTARGFMVYVLEDHEITVNPSMGEGPCRDLVRKLEKTHGTKAPTNKRNPAEIKERQVQARAALRSDIDRHQLELDDIVARRARQLDGAASALTNAEITRIQTYIEAKERELNEIEDLMRGATLSTNRAKHRA